MFLTGSFFYSDLGRFITSGNVVNYRVRNKSVYNLAVGHRDQSKINAVRLYYTIQRAEIVQVIIIDFAFQNITIITLTIIII